MLKEKNKKIPLEWALDKEGRPTTNPDAALEGTVTPISVPKGSALAILVDILSGVLSNSAYLDNIGSLSKTDAKQNLGFSMMVIDPSIFMPIETFKEVIDQYIERIKNSPKAEGVEEIFVPGELENKQVTKSLENGISLSNELVEELSNIAKNYDIHFNNYLS